MPFSLSRVRYERSGESPQTANNECRRGARRDPFLSTSTSMYMTRTKVLGRSHLNGEQGQVGCTPTYRISRRFALSCTTARHQIQVLGRFPLFLLHVSRARLIPITNKIVVLLPNKAASASLGSDCQNCCRMHPRMLSRLDMVPHVTPFESDVPHLGSF
jgi:hypothetical protein